MERSFSVLGLVRSLRASGVASLVAPRNPLGRVGAAVAVTAVLIGVQLGLVVAHAGSGLCRLAGGGCNFSTPLSGGGLLKTHTDHPGKAPLVAQRAVPPRDRPTQAQAHRATRVQTVAFRAPTSPQDGQALQPMSTTFSNASSAAASKKRQLAGISAVAAHHAAHHAHHVARHGVHQSVHQSVHHKS